MTIMSGGESWISRIPREEGSTLKDIGEEGVRRGMHADREECSEEEDKLEVGPSSWTEGKSNRLGREVEGPAPPKFLFLDFERRWCMPSCMISLTQENQLRGKMKHEVSKAAEEESSKRGRRAQARRVQRLEGTVIKKGRRDTKACKYIIQK